MHAALVGMGHAATADDVSNKIKELTTAIEQYDEKAPVAPKAINDLRVLLLSKKLVGPNAASAFTEISTEVQNILNDEKSRNQVSANASSAASAKALFDALMKISDDLIVKDRFRDLLDKIAGIVVAPGSGGVLSNQAVLKAAMFEKATPPTALQKSRADFERAWAIITEDFKDEMFVKDRFRELMDKTAGIVLAPGGSGLLSNQAVLRAAILEKTTEPTPFQKSRANFDKAWAIITEDYKIHVLRSWFGDLRTRWGEGRLCAATSAMATKCEARSECKLDPAPVTQPGNAYDQQILCGFDPAPLVDPSAKGVAVEFTCVRGGKQVWDKLARQPGINPDSGAPWEAAEVNLATLRSSGMSFRCPFPPREDGSSN